MEELTGLGAQLQSQKLGWWEPEHLVLNIRLHACLSPSHWGFSHSVCLPGCGDKPVGCLQAAPRLTAAMGIWRQSPGLASLRAFQKFLVGWLLLTGLFL